MPTPMQRILQSDAVRQALQANRPAGWQTVPHLHLHVLPRRAGDGVELTWPRKEPGIERLRELAARLRVPGEGKS